MTDNNYQSNDDLQMSEEEIVETIRKTVIDHGGNADFIIGDAYYHGLYGLRKDDYAAMAYFQRSAFSGYAKGQYAYAWILAQSDSGYDDLQLALEYANKATAQGLDKAKGLAGIIRHALENYGYTYFMNPRGGNVARYDEGKQWFVMKRCYDTEAEADVDGTKAGEEEDLNINCFIHPLAFGNSYSPINEALYESFGTHWGVNPIYGDVWMDDEAAGQFALHYDVDGINDFKRVSTAQLMDNLASIQKPTNSFFYLFKQANTIKADADDLKALGEAYAFGYYGLSDCETCKENYEPATNWLLEAYKKGSDDALRDLYLLNYFRNRIMKIVHNPEPVDNEAEVMASAAAMTGDEVFALAQRYALGKDAPRNYAFSARLLEMAVGKGNAMAQYELTRFKESGFFFEDETPPVAEIFDGYKKAFDMGYTAAAGKLGDLMFRYGYDEDEADIYELLQQLFNTTAGAAAWYKACGDNGDVDRMLEYAIMTSLGNMIAQQDEADTKQEVMSVINSLPKDNISVLTFLGDIYRLGLFGEAVDYDKAWRLYARAANSQDYSDTIKFIFDMALPSTSLGLGLDYDYPLPKNPLRGSGDAMRCMAEMILTGQHGDKNEQREKAVEMLEEAVKRNNVEAPLLLNAIEQGEEENEINRLIEMNYTREERQRLVNNYIWLGDVFSAGIYELASCIHDLGEKTEKEEDGTEE